MAAPRPGRAQRARCDTPWLQLGDLLKYGPFFDTHIYLIFMYIYIYVQMYMYICINAHIYMHMYVCMYTYTHRYQCVCTYTNIDIYLYMYTCVSDCISFLEALSEVPTHLWSPILGAYVEKSNELLLLVTRRSSEPDITMPKPRYASSASYARIQAQ